MIPIVVVSLLLQLGKLCTVALFGAARHLYAATFRVHYSGSSDPLILAGIRCLSFKVLYDSCNDWV